MFGLDRSRDSTQTATALTKTPISLEEDGEGHQEVPGEDSVQQAFVTRLDDQSAERDLAARWHS